MLDYHQLKALDLGVGTHTYTERDTMLYALGIGLGVDPLDPAQLSFIYEQNLRAVPSMATILGGGSASGWRDESMGVDWLRIVHGEQRIRLFKALPVAATLTSSSRIVSLTDKGSARGAVMVLERTLRQQGSDEPLASSTQVLFLRGNGGFSAVSGVSDPGPERLPPVPEGKAPIELELPSLLQAALIYRLSGDYNPLHVDPQVARAAGFEKPILHGLCSFGMATHAVLRACCDYDAARIKSVAMRFTAPVYPGESLKFEIWRVDDTTLRLRARASARNVVVLNGGVIELNASEHAQRQPLG